MQLRPETPSPHLSHSPVPQPEYQGTPDGAPLMSSRHLKGYFP